VSALVPVLLLALPLEVITGGWRYVAAHFVFQLLAGALLIELMFWSFGKVPFTCSYFPGSTNLAILVFFYVYGFTGFGFNMADLELALEGRAGPLLLCFAAAIILLKLSWHRRAAPEPIQFDGEERAIQALDLS